MLRDTNKPRYLVPAVRVTPVWQEQAFLQSVQTVPIGDWTPDPEPEIEF